MALLVTAVPVGHELAGVVSFNVANGYFCDVDGPTSVATSNGNGQRNPVGFITRDSSGNAYMYAAGVASVAAGDWCFLNQGGTIAAVRVLNDANSGGAGIVGVAMAAIVASCWGWFQIYGVTPTAFANVATGGSANVAVYRSGTTARLAVSAVAKDSVFSAWIAAAAASNVAQAILNYPFVQDQSTL